MDIWKTISYSGFCEYVQPTRPGERRGQHLMNELYRYHREAAMFVAEDPESDPFYEDAKMDRFWARLARFYEEREARKHEFNG